MSNVIPFQATSLPPSVLQAMQAMQSSELSDNIGTSYAVISVRGKVFRIKHGGNEVPLMMEHNGQQFPAPCLDVIIPKASSALSKTFYSGGFTEGSDAQPDCWSEDGLNPLSPMSQRPVIQSTGQVVTDCRTCPNNVFGSRVNTATGKGGKACADTRKVVVLPANDLINERFGGGMLLRVPAASLGGLAEYDRKLKASGIPYFAVVTRITFDQTVAYPKLAFEAVRMITDAEAATIMDARNNPHTDAILTGAHATSAPALPMLAGQAIPAALTAPVAAPTVTPMPSAVVFGAATPVPAPVSAPPPAAPVIGPAVDSAFFASLDSLIQS